MFTHSFPWIKSSLESAMLGGVKTHGTIVISFKMLSILWHTVGENTSQHVNVLVSLPVNSQLGHRTYLAILIFLSQDMATE